MHLNSPGEMLWSRKYEKRKFWYWPKNCLNSVINGNFLFYSLIAKTMVSFLKVARLSLLKPVRGLEDDQAEMSETIGQCLQLLGSSIFDVNFVVIYYEKSQFTIKSKIWPCVAAKNLMKLSLLIAMGLLWVAMGFLE